MTAKQESEDIGSAILSILSKFFEKLKSGGKKLFEEFKLWVDNVLKGLRKELGIAEFGGADGFITKTLAEDFFGVLRNVRKVEDEIRALDIEKAMIFDSKGNPFVELNVGKVGSVNLTFKDILKARQKILANGGKKEDLIITHNHPLSSGLSASDILKAMEHNA